MNRKKFIIIFFLIFWSAGLQASVITTNIIHANQMNECQWKEVNNLWCDSFYNAYKDLPFDQVDDDIKDGSKESLIDYLQRRFDKYQLIALKDSYSLALAYKDGKLVGYTLYHMLQPQSIIHIDHFAVDSNCQGQGIGKILLESTIKSMPGAIAVVLTTRILNKKAQLFYEKQGFYELTYLENFIFDSRYSILLRKDIKIQ